MRRVVPVLGLLVVVAGLVVGGDFFGVRTQLFGEEAPEPREPAVSDQAGGDASTTPGSQSDDSTPEATRVRSQPWWQHLATLEGPDASATDVDVDEGALQWRLRWECETGSLAVTTGGDGLVDATCPDRGTEYLTDTGPTSVDVDGEGAWEATVEQQIDVPLEEAPLPEMDAADAQEVARGSFYDIDQTGRGEVVIYRLADDSYALRLDDFFVTPNVDLEIRLSPQERPQTTPEFDKPGSDYVETLEATAGSMNFPVPDDVDPTEAQSVVIWCPPVENAYAAASLEWAE